MRRPDYSAHEHLLSGVRPYSEMWRMGIGLVIAMAVIIALSLIFNGIISTRAPVIADNLRAQPPGTDPTSLLILLGSYGFATFGIVAAGLMLYGRGLAMLLGGWQRTWRQFCRAILGLTGLYLLTWLLPPWWGDSFLNANLQFGVWLALLPLSLTAVLIQVSAEEILFRGYLQQTLAARFKSPLIWMLVPSMLFALGHYMPSEAGDNAVMIAIWSGLFGLAAADLTARSGTLGPAIALHFANNVTALLVVSMPGMMSGLSLFTTPFGLEDVADLRPWLVVELVALLCSWLAVRLALRV